MARLQRQAPDLDHQRDRQRPGHDGGMRPDGPFLQHHAGEPVAVVQQLSRPDIAGHQHRARRHLALAALAGEMAHQLVGEVVEIVGAFAQIGVGDPREPGAHGGLLPLHRDFRRQARIHRGQHPPQPALVIGEHAIGFEHVAMLPGPAQQVAGQEVVDLAAQGLRRLGQAAALLLHVLGDGIGQHHPRLVQVHHALGRALLGRHAAGVIGPDMGPRELRVALAQEGAQLGHLGQQHGHDFQPVNVVFAVMPRLAVLHDEHAQHLAQALDRHAEEGHVDLLAGARDVLEAAGVLGVGGLDRLGPAGDLADQALPDQQEGAMHRIPVQTLGGAELQLAVAAAQVDRTHLGRHRGRDQRHDGVHALLAVAGLRHHPREPLEQQSRASARRGLRRAVLPRSRGAAAFRRGHAVGSVIRGSGLGDRSRRRRVRRPRAGPAPRAPCTCGPPEPRP